MLATPSILSNKPTNPAYKPATSLKPIQVTPKMTDADTELAGPLRRKLDRLQKQADRTKDHLINARKGEDVALADWSTLHEDQEQLELTRKEYERIYDQLCEVETNPTAMDQDGISADLFDQAIRMSKLIGKRLMSTSKIQGTTQALEMAVGGLNNAYNAAPEKSHLVALEAVLTRSKNLEEELLVSSLGEDHPLRHRAAASLKEAYLIQAKTSKDITSDIKPFREVPKANFKIPPLIVPSFSGKTEDWLPFWRQFNKAVHTKADLDDETRLSYLIQALKDPGMKATYSERMDDDGAYTAIVAELQAEYDKPRWMHRKYCEAMKNLATNPHTRAGMKDLINQVTTIHKGFIRLNGENCRQILTSMTEAVMSKDLRTLWNQRTDKIKNTPPIEDLLLFIKEQADQMEDKEIHPSKQYQEKAKTKPSTKYRGSSHVAVASTPSVPSSTPSTKGKGASPTQNLQRPLCRYICPLCSDNHYVYFCGIFDKYTVSQRKEYVHNHNLCNNCLKAGHASSVCRSTYKCKTCQGNHNTLLHEGSNNLATQPSQGTVHVAAPVDPSELTSTLITTAELMVKGPTGRVARARALLDGGSGISIISNHLQQTLQLQKTKESMFISGVGRQTEQSAFPITSIHLSAIDSSVWEKQQRVAVMPKVTQDLPLLAASSVRDLPHLKGKDFADKHFDIPGRIDLLLGEDALRDVYLPGEAKGPPGTPTAWNTVFGWVLRGCYTPDEVSSTMGSPVCTTLSEEAQSTDKLLTKFWELEDEPRTPAALTPEEEKVQDHYRATHSYDNQAQRYMVSLPKKEGSLTLGESRTQALNRARANERSLLRKGTWDKFQDVIKEYITLGHAQPVTAQEMTLPPASCYYMPMHGVYKDSSTTTKLRVVFDASAKTTSDISLNDLLAVGPTLHPTLDHILLKFRSYRVALTGDISKMYREVLLNPEDRQLHRFIWRPQQDQPYVDYCMNRVTFGVAASPYLAVKTLQQAAKDFGEDFPQAR